MKSFVACAVALACAAAPAFAEEKCWTAKEMTAARVRDLQSVLMVGALQCRASGHDVLAEFNKFVVAGRSIIVTENDVLKAHFVKVRGTKEGARAYDSFTTALANDHAGSTSQMQGFCQAAQAMAVEAAAAVSLSNADEALELIAERLGERPAGVADACADVKPNVVVATMNPPAFTPALPAAAPAQQTAVASAAPGTVYMLVPAPAGGAPAGTATVVLAPAPTLVATSNPGGGTN